MKRIKYSLVIIFVFIIDQISKIVVANNINLNESKVVIKNFLNLTYVKNKGAAFGMFEGYTSIITIISVVILFYLLYELFKNKKNDTLTNISLSFIIGGLIGNLYDRIILHCVRDFFDFTLFNKGFAIFNVGDSFIVVGCILFFVGALLEVKHVRSK